MQKRVIQLISFASPEEQVRLSSMLWDLKYQVNTIDSGLWLRGSTNNTGSIELLFFGNGAFLSAPVEAALGREHAGPRVSILSSPGTADYQRIAQLCEEFLIWPCSESELSLRLRRLGERWGIHAEKPADSGLHDEFLGLNLIGRSPAFIEVLKFIKKVACYEAPVFIEGETGTGKEMMARAIHYLGPRHRYPFIPVNCGALPDNLVENELFGHARGAYTDAKQDQPGLIDQANGGTLFLDEIEALSEKGQVALLRFLQDKVFKPLGAKAEKTADVRIIAASNMSLQKMVEAGCFRQDLFFRLNVLSMSLPPLRERGADIEILAEHFMEKYRRIYDLVGKFLKPETLARMKRYDWPGNVRELENAVHRAFLLAEGSVVKVEQEIGGEGERRHHVADRRKQSGFHESFGDAKAKMINDFERRYLCWLMAETGGNVTQAAKRAGKERRALGKLLTKHGINKEDYAGPQN